MALNYKKIGLHVLKVLIALGILYFVYQKIDTETLIQNVSNISIPILLLTAVMLAVSKFFSSFRLTYFIRDLGIDISQWTNWKLYLLGMFYNLFLPGGVGGDGYKIYYLNKISNLKTKDTFWPFLLDRVSGMFSLLILILLFSLFVEVKFLPNQDIISVVLIVLGFLAMFLLVKIIKPIYLKTFIITLPSSFLVQLTQIGCIYLFLNELNIFDKLTEYFLLFFVSSIASIIPITPGGLGLRELTYQYGVEYFDINAGAGVLLGTLFFFITLIVSFCGIYYHFKGVDKE